MPGRYGVMCSASRRSVQVVSWLFFVPIAAHCLEGVLDDRRVEQLLRDGAVVALVGLRGLEVARLPLDHDRLQLQRSHLRARSAARVTGLRPAHDGARQDEVLAGARDVDHREIARPRAAEVVRDPLANVDVVQAHIRRGVEERDLAVLHVQQRPRRGLSVEHDVVDAVHADEGREVVARVGVEEDARFRRPRRRVPARGAGDDAGQHAGSKDQRDVGMQRLQGLVEQPVQVEHVGAPSRQERADHGQRRVAALHLAPLEVDEHRRALRRVLRGLRQLGHEARDAVPNRHSV